MARTDTLPHFLTDVADAIRTKKGTNETIVASDFDTEIENLPSGGSANLESKSVTITSNTTTNITPSQGYDGLSSVSVTTNLSPNIGEYFETEINSNLNDDPMAYDYYPANLVKKYPNVTIGNNVTVLKYAFSRFYKVPKLIGGANVVDMSSLFYGCLATSIDLSELNTESVTNMSSMFYSCSNLTSLDLSNLDTGEVTNMGSMFSSCSSLTSLDLSNLDTSKVTSMSNMFSSCSGLTSLDLSDLNTSEVVNMSSVFSYSPNLESIDLTDIDTGKVTSMSNLFNGCTNLEEIEGIEDLDTSSVTTFSNMFRSCSSLTGTLDLSDYDFSATTNNALAYLISGTGITTLNLGNVDMSNKTSFQNVLNGATNLVNFSANFTNVPSSSTALNLQNFAYGASALKRLDLSSMTYNLDNKSIATGAFAGCTSLEFLDIRGFDPIANFSNRTNMFGNDTIGKVPANCEIIVKNDMARNSLRSSFNWLTNIKTVAEYEAE